MSNLNAVSASPGGDVWAVGDYTQLLMPHKVRSLGDREVQSRSIGELVMDELRQLDEVAYVRFASVYRQFEDVEAFHEEIQRLRSQQSAPPADPERQRAGKRERRREVSRDQLSLLPADAPAPPETPASSETK